MLARSEAKNDANILLLIITRCREIMISLSEKQARLITRFIRPSANPNNRMKLSWIKFWSNEFGTLMNLILDLSVLILIRALFRTI
jgi:hypothetical protein